jgi:tetratricopeptide (TPR) repeat protein
MMSLKKMFTTFMASAMALGFAPYRADSAERDGKIVLVRERGGGGGGGGRSSGGSGGGGGSRSSGGGGGGSVRSFSGGEGGGGRSSGGGGASARSFSGGGGGSSRSSGGSSVRSFSGGGGGPSIRSYSGGSSRGSGSISVPRNLSGGGNSAPRVSPRVSVPRSSGGSNNSVQIAPRNIQPRNIESSPRIENRPRISENVAPRSIERSNTAPRSIDLNRGSGNNNLNQLNQTQRNREITPRNDSTPRNIAPKPNNDLNNLNPSIVRQRGENRGSNNNIDAGNAVPRNSIRDNDSQTRETLRPNILNRDNDNRATDRVRDLSNQGNQGNDRLNNVRDRLNTSQDRLKNNATDANSNAADRLRSINRDQNADPNNLVRDLNRRGENATGNDAANRSLRRLTEGAKPVVTPPGRSDLAERLRNDGNGNRDDKFEVIRNNQKITLDNSNRPGLGSRDNRDNISDRRNQLAGLLGSARNRGDFDRGDRDGRDGRDGWDGRDRDGRDWDRDRDWDRNRNWRGNGRFRDWQVWNSRYYWRHNNWHRGYWRFSLFNPYVALGFGFGGYGWGGGGYGLGYGGWGYPYADAFGWSPWGANYLCYNFGYYDYVNPYYQQPVQFYGGTSYDYSQPLIVSQDVQPAEQPAQEDPNQAIFNQAREEFRAGNYEQALQRTEEALAKTPKDPILHEFRALALFALGRYQDAAAPLYSVLAVGPGMDWSTMAGVYASVDTYTAQLRALEDFHRQNPDNAATSFVLAYHYLTCSHLEAAANQLDNVLRINPQDLVAQRLLQALPLEQSAPAGAAQQQTADKQALAVPDLPAADAAKVQSLDVAGFYGTWNATNANGTAFKVTLNEDGSFEWTADQKGEAKTVKGVFTIDGETLAMEPDTGGVMLAKVSAPAEGGFSFRMLGALESDPGLNFKKM